MPTTLITMPQANLTAGHAFNSLPNPGAVALPANVTSLACRLTMPAADQSDPANSITWTIYCAPPGPAPSQPPPSAGWTAVSQDSWQGGTHVDKFSGLTVPNETDFAESVPPQYQGGWVAAAGQNTGANIKVGCTVTANP